MKLFSSSAALLLILYSCSPSIQNKEESGNELVVKQYFEYFNAHQWDKMVSLYADTVDIKDPAYGINLKMSKDEILKKYTELNQSIPDVNDSIVDIYLSENGYIIVEFISSGTTPDQAKFELPICTIFKIQKGLITKDYTYYDNF